jgi:hypothetical protein
MMLNIDRVHKDRTSDVFKKCENGFFIPTSLRRIWQSISHKTAMLLRRISSI